MASSLKGACNCGAIQISIPERDFPKESMLCHCLNCRASSGALATLNLTIPTSAVKVDKGHPKNYLETECASGDTMERWFCGDCGSACFSIVTSKKDVSFVKGGLFVKEFKKIGRTLPEPKNETWWRNHEEWEQPLGCNLVD